MFSRCSIFPTYLAIHPSMSSNGIPGAGCRAREADAKSMGLGQLGGGQGSGCKWAGKCWEMLCLMGCRWWFHGGLYGDLMWFIWWFDGG